MKKNQEKFNKNVWLCKVNVLPFLHRRKGEGKEKKYIRKFDK